MNMIGSALLQFDTERNPFSKGKELRHRLSVVFQVGRSLWLANDETISLERLSQEEGPRGVLRFSGHRHFPLGDYLDLPVPPPTDPDDIEEADVEGVDVRDGYLWLVGSHSLKRARPRDGEAAAKGAKRLAKVSRDGNRYLLARIPVVEAPDGQSLAKMAKGPEGKRTAARLRGDDTGNELTQALARDEHLKASLAIPGKDNGFDIEGLAVAGDRVLLGLRGPVLRGWAVILELRPAPADGDPTRLKLKGIGPDRLPYRKHFLHLDGLGIRDLCLHGEDLLILAGPTMDLDGPVKIYRWLGGAAARGEGLVSGDALSVVGDLPFGQGAEKGTDHAEGICLLAPDGRAGPALLVVYDAASPRRLKRGEGTVTGDIFALH